MKGQDSRPPKRLNLETVSDRGDSILFLWQGIIGKHMMGIHLGSSVAKQEGWIKKLKIGRILTL